MGKNRKSGQLTFISLSSHLTPHCICHLIFTPCYSNLPNKHTGTITKTLVDVLWIFLSSENYFNWLTWFLVLLRTEGQESSQSIEILFTDQKYSQNIDQGFFLWNSVKIPAHLFHTLQIIGKAEALLKTIFWLIWRPAKKETVNIKSHCFIPQGQPHVIVVELMGGASS